MEHIVGGMKHLKGVGTYNGGVIFYGSIGTDEDEKEE